MLTDKVIRETGVRRGETKNREGYIRQFYNERTFSTLACKYT